MFLDSYNLSYRESALSLFTLSGLPYSKRHWELSNTSDSKKLCWGHRTIAVLEAIPVIGGLAAIIERIAFYIKENCFNAHPNSDSSLRGKKFEPLNTPAKSPWKPRALAIDVAVQKMWKNSKKAISEHREKTSAEYAPLEKALPSIASMLNEKPAPLAFKHTAADAQGKRPKMEDVHFYLETEKGIITAVLDGHGGAEVANYASKAFQEKFFARLTQTNGNVHQTFEEVVDEIHKEIANNPDWNSIGTTAVISYIDKQSNLIYTATLGDSEANLYRPIDQQLMSIPLSCVRDWSSQKDATRAAIALGDPDIAEDWPKIPNPKFLRYPTPYCGINVSRAIGDVFFSGTRDKPGVIHKPKITVNQLKSGDILVLGCDGLKDYVPENEIIASLKENAQDPAQTLVRHAIDVKHSTDNVTVLVININ